MPDGSYAFNFPPPQYSRLRPGEIVVDLFAGGGGASEALKQALGVDPALAYNHDEWAIGMHAANHPLTSHHREDIWHADPCRDVAGRPVGWFHASPDCTHFSQAKGGQPRSRKTRALSWVVLKWVGQLGRVGNAPRIISLENVWQILTWGPLIAKRDRETGRVVTLDLVRDPATGRMVNRIANKGERVPVERQALVPDKRHAGRTWRQFVRALQERGYTVEWRKLVASDFGAGTSRERLFLLARRDGEPIVWPAPTHGKGEGLQKTVSAADCLDFSIACPSIFSRKRPLAEATLRRIAKGVMRHVVNSADPFIVPATHQGADRVNDVRAPLPTITAANRGELMVVAPDLAPFLTEHANASTQRTMGGDEPLRTICAGVKGGHFSVVAPILAGVGGRAGQSEPRPGGEPIYTITTKGDTALLTPTLVTLRKNMTGTEVREPLRTICASAEHHAIVSPVMLQAGHGEGRPDGVKRWGSGSRHAEDPVSTITASGGGQALVTAHLTAMAQNVIGTDMRDPVPTVLAGAARFGVVNAFLEQANGGFYEGGGRDLRDPMSTITATGSQQQLVTADVQPIPPAETPDASGSPDARRSAEKLGEHGCGDAPRDAGGMDFFLSEEQQAKALRVAAFLVNYYGNGTALHLRDPLDTVTTRDRMALVTVVIRGTPYVIVDIGLRMLKPHELYRAQGFPPDYVIDRTADGRPITTTAAVRMVGNSVSPPPLVALARANLDPARVPDRIAA